MKHTEGCLEYMSKAENMIKEYMEKWPNHCKYCGGWGGSYSTYDPSPSGVSLGSGYMIDIDPCPECCEKGNCPRCGEHILDPVETEDWENCPHCGFDWESPEGMPPDPECVCWHLDSIFD